MWEQIKAKLGFMRESDKQGHFWAGLAIALALGPLETTALADAHVLLQFVVLVGVIGVIGVCKEEVVDKNTGGDVSMNDAIATLIGGAIGAAMHCFFLVRF